MKIAEIMHFIWAGQKRLMPDASVMTVLRWHVANPDFQVFIWVDKKTAPGYWFDYYMKRLKIVANYCFIGDVVKLDKIVFKDIEEEEISTPLVRYEIDRLRPNFGASSDILRIRALYKYGGFYADTDVLPAEQSLAKSHIFSENESYHRFYVDANSQGSGMIGNDVFLSTKNNPHLRFICSLVEENYRQTEDEFSKSDPVTGETVFSFIAVYNPTIRQTYVYDNYKDGEYIERITPMKTGGGPIRSFLKNEMLGKWLQTPQGAGDIFRNLSAYRKVAINHRAWINQPLVHYDESEVLSKVIASIRFEAEELQFLRLDDHVDNYASVMGLTLEAAGTIIISQLEKEEIDYEQVKSFQLLFTNLATVEFYQKIKLPLDKSFWLPKLHDTATYDCDFLKVMLQERIEERNPNLLYTCYFLIEHLHEYLSTPNSYNKRALDTFSEYINILLDKLMQITIVDEQQSIKTKLINYCQILKSKLSNNGSMQEIKLEHVKLSWIKNGRIGKDAVTENTLSFVNYGLCDEDIATIVLPALSKQTSAIDCLDLSCNNLSDQCAEQLSKININKLILWRNNFRFSIGKIVNNPYLEFLNVSDNPLAYVSIQALEDQDKVQCLYTEISGTNVAIEKEISPRQRCSIM